MKLGRDPIGWIMGLLAVGMVAFLGWLLWVGAQDLRAKSTQEHRNKGDELKYIEVEKHGVICYYFYTYKAGLSCVKVQ